MPYTGKERALLSLYFSVVDGPPHADVYLVRNLPPEVAATLNGVYSRSSLSMRDNFLSRLRKGLAETGRSLEDLDIAPPARDLLTEILADKSGQFLKTYAIDHGHNSLREGSVLHLAVENVSQLVTRFLQRERRCSFEESSTRYISFSKAGHWRDPDVMAAGGAAAAAYEEILRSTFELYERTTTALFDWLHRARPLREGEKKDAYERALRAEAFDAARYLLTPALFTKWGMVADARTLSDMISELLSHPLAEFRLVGERLKAQGDLVVPTLLKHAARNEYLAAQLRGNAELVRALAAAPEPAPAPAAAAKPAAATPSVELLSWDRELDSRLLASLAFEHSRTGLSDLTRAARALGAEQRRKLFDAALAQRGVRDPLPLACEGAQPFELEVLVDFGAYRDIGRHRKGFQQQQALTVAHGFATPPLLAEAGLDGAYREVLERVAELQQTVAREHPFAAGYVTPFAFLQRVRLVFDPRQIAYFIELRSAPEGHFSYRDVAIAMFRAVERVSPLFASAIRAHVGPAFLGRMESEQGADERRRQRMLQAGDTGLV
jgi:thymidylate synthase ThyX